MWLIFGVELGTKAGAWILGMKAPASACRALPVVEALLESVLLEVPLWVLASCWFVYVAETSSWLGLSEETEPAALLSQGVSGGGDERLGLPAGGVLGDVSESMV